MDATITLKQYLGKHKTFVIPNYQRGYVWGKNRPEEKDSVTNLLDDMLSKYKKSEDLFLQGFTVTETDNDIVLIDGQQRTTFLFLLLKWLGYQDEIKIRYEVRTISGDCLNSIDYAEVSSSPVPFHDDELEQEEYQDIYFFKKTLNIVSKKLNDSDTNPSFDRQKFMNFLLDRIKFLYINIPDKNQAVRVFTMMNGSKAVMLPEEVIKAEILRLASKSKQDEIDFDLEWENNLLRSRYAREWDKWLYWWRRQDVQDMYDCQNTMGYLISTFFKLRMGEILTFESFKNLYLSNETPKEAKDTFDGLRNLQKRFEDAFNNVKVHNIIGAILRIFKGENKNKFIRYYFIDNQCKNLEDYYKMVFLGMTHDEIVNENIEKFAEKYNETSETLNDDMLYMGDANEKEIAFRFLLRLNVDMDIEQNRVFKFDIWEDRSLEHIFAKSNVWHKDEKGTWLNGVNEVSKKHVDFTDKKNLLRDDIKWVIEGKEFNTTEHSIGNLVLLYGNENSSFNSSDFLEKKRKFFSPVTDKPFKSRTLLHTVCVFAEKQDWNGQSIVQNKIDTINKFEQDYKDLKIKYYQDEK